MKPFWALAGVALLSTLGVAGAVIVASSGGEEEVLQQVETATPSPEVSGTPTAPAETPAPSPSTAACDPPPASAPGAKLWRWGDMTIMIPEGVLAYGDRDQERRAVLVIYPEEINQSYRTTIDATTGSVLSVTNDSTGLRPKEAEIQAALTTISICPFDQATALWPYNGDPPQTQRQTFGNISFIELDPDVGIHVGVGTAGSEGPGGALSREFLAVRSARSLTYIDAQDGQLMQPAQIVPEEQDAFTRYLSTVQVLNPQ